MGNVFTEDLKAELLSRLSDFSCAWDAEVSTDIKYLEYGINKGDLSVIHAVYNLTYSDRVYELVEGILKEISATK
ncbi:hypothetical protein U9I18_000235 [Bacillus phage KKP_4048]